jgi:hypothetical protein
MSMDSICNHWMPILLNVLAWNMVPIWCDDTNTIMNFFKEFQYHQNIEISIGTWFYF